MDKKVFGKGALIGALTGVVAGILFAPKSGKETRADLVKHVEDIKSDLVDKLTRIEDFSRETYDNTVSSITDTYETAKKITPKEAEEIKDILNSSFGKIEKVIKKAKNKK